MTTAQEAVRTLEKQGLTVQGLTGPEGWRFQITARSGFAHQISEAELLQLVDEKKLDWQGVVEIAIRHDEK
jgi:hypothetical protein